MNIKPIEKSTLPDDIITQIKNLIREGGLQPGDKLPTERELAEEFHVGRSTVRESLKALAVMKVIKKTQQGTFITDSMSGAFSDTLRYKILLERIDFYELLETRKLLEVNLTGLAAKRTDNKDILEKLEDALNTMETGLAGNDWSIYIKGDIAFHNTIALASGNRIMAEIFNAISILLVKSQREIINQSLALSSLKYHRKIYQQIVKNNSAKAKDYMLQHLKNIEKEYIRINPSKDFMVN